MYFYELHEGDDELFSDALLVHELEFDDEQFLELVLEARGRVLGSFEEDTLVEAIAHDLERQHGFVFVDDAQLSVAVNVAVEDGGTFVAELVDEEELLDGEEFRSLLVDIDPNELN
ncbi:MAG: hypothetical protein ACXWQ6_09825 [Candidatus Limnocylindrales bacterium]